MVSSSIVLQYVNRIQTTGCVTQKIFTIQNIRIESAVIFGFLQCFVNAVVYVFI